MKIILSFCIAIAIFSITLATSSAQPLNDTEYEAGIINDIGKYSTAMTYYGVLDQWQDYQRRTIKYSPSMKKLEFFQENFSDPNWRNDLKYDYKYNENDELISVEIRDWDYDKWIYTQKYIYEWCENGALQCQITQKWVNDGWVNYSKSSRCYNCESELLTEITNQVWNGEAWNNSTNYLYEYDNSNYLTNCYVQVWDGSQWIDNSSETRTYNSNHKLMSKITKAVYNEEWIMTSKETAIYDDNDRLINYTINQYSTDGVEIPKNKYCYAYNDFGQVITEIKQKWDTLNLNWSNQNKTNYTYTVSGKVHEIYTYYTVYSKWNELYHIIILYDENDLVSSYTKLQYSDSKWNNYEKINYDYTITSAIEPVTNNGNTSLHSFPNPFSNENTVLLNLDESSVVSIKVIDSKGNEVTELVSGFLNQGTYSYSLNNLNLSQGIYFISLNTGKKVEVLQVVSIK